MGIAPAAPRHAVDVSVGDVHAPDEAHTSVDDGYFAVVAVVDFARETREPHVQKGPHLDTLGAHTLEKGAFDACTPHVVVENPHLDALPGFGDERIAQAAARAVVAEDVVLYMNVMLGFGDSGEQSFHFGGSVDVGGDAAATERHGMGGVEEQVDQRPMVRGEGGTVGRVGLLALCSKTLAHTARDTAPFGEVLTEEEVDDEPDTWSEEQHQNPGQRAQRIAVVGDDDQHDTCDRKRVDAQKQYVEKLRQRY